jgi:hypothetical protein
MERLGDVLVKYAGFGIGPAQRAPPGDVVALRLSQTNRLRKSPTRSQVSIQYEWIIDSCRSSGNTISS